MTLPYDPFPMFFFPSSLRSEALTALAAMDVTWAITNSNREVLEKFCEIPTSHLGEPLFQDCGVPAARLT